MKKIIALVLCVAGLICITGCKSFFVDEELELYTKTVNDLMTALDQGDAQRLYALFAPAVQDGKLEEQIEQLLSLYTGPVERIGDYSCLAGDYQHEMGERRRSAYTTFPILADGSYYWFSLDLMYENTVDEQQVGITQLDVFTADAYYEFWSGENKWQKAPGLNLFVKNVEAYHVISINNYPYDYHPGTPIAPEEVKTFFEASTSMSAFAAQFGEPASTDEFGVVYPLLQIGEEAHFLVLHCEADEIYSAKIYNNFAYIDSFLNDP